MGGALVTGAGRGLGLEIARRLVARGLEVSLSDVDGDAAARAAAELGGSTASLALDVRDAEACREAAAGVLERAGSLEVWVNNAGILSTGLTWEQDPGVQRAMLEVNALGTFNGTLAALERMRPAGRGHVINIVSLAGLAAAPGEAAYSASKHAALAFTLGTLLDLRRSGETRIRLSAICPDGIWSPMLADRLDDPDAAASFSGTLLSTSRAAEAAVGVLDRPRVLVTIPRWRGVAVRLFDAFPEFAVRAVPLFMADARRRQKSWKRRIEAGRPPG